MRKKRVRRFAYGGGAIELHGRVLLDATTGRRYPIEKGRERAVLAMLRSAFRELP